MESPQRLHDALAPGSGPHRAATSSHTCPLHQTRRQVIHRTFGFASLRPVCDLQQTMGFARFQGTTAPARLPTATAGICPWALT